MLKVILYIAAGCVLIFGYAKYIEKRSVFFPEKKIEFTPASLNITFEDVNITTPDKFKINGWFIPRNNAKRTVLFCHGNAGNIGDRLDKINMFQEIGFNVLIFDYRGYGRSQGRPSEKGLYLDTRAAYEYLLNERKIIPDEIILYGESLGNAAVIDLASKRQVKAVILEGAFSSGKDMAGTLYPFIPAFLFSDIFNSIQKIKKINAPKLFLHSVDDEIVPYKIAKKLFESAQEPKYFVELNGSHNDAFLESKDKYLSAIISFINRL
jgi:fermentation-respiration switch protein FrsA (DUF1100 family)